MPAMVLRLSLESKAQTGWEAGACLARDGPSVIDLARTSTDPDERADFVKREAGCRERGIAAGTDWAETRIAKNAWFRFATAAKRAAFRFRVHGGRRAN